MHQQEETCGQELAASASVPDQFAQLFQHVARNLRDHADSVGTDTPAAQREHDAMLAVAQGYETTAAEAQRTANIMRTMQDIPPAPHARENWDKGSFALWMTRKIEMQRELARMLLEHADQSERVLKLANSA
jgi:hypothetical protein